MSAPLTGPRGAARGRAPDGANGESRGLGDGAGSITLPWRGRRTRRRRGGSGSNAYQRASRRFPGTARLDGGERRCRSNDAREVLGSAGRGQPGGRTGIGSERRGQRMRSSHQGKQGASTTTGAEHAGSEGGLKWCRNYGPGPTRGPDGGYRGTPNAHRRCEVPLRPTVDRGGGSRGRGTADTPRKRTPFAIWTRSRVAGEAWSRLAASRGQAGTNERPAGCDVVASPLILHSSERYLLGPKGLRWNGLGLAAAG